MRWWIAFALLLALCIATGSESKSFDADSEFNRDLAADEDSASVSDSRSNDEDEDEDESDVRLSERSSMHGSRRRRSISRRRSSSERRRRHHSHSERRRSTSRRRSLSRRRSTSRRRRSSGHATQGGSCSSENQKGRTRCGEYCLCKSKKWKCCRVRFEVNNLIHREGGPALLTRYMEVYAKMTRHEMTQKDFKAIVEAHRTLFLAGIHTLPSFGAWHRWYLLQIENMLRRHDCRITIPYVDWGRISHTWRQSKLYTPAIMGTDGSPKHYNCVMDGPFKLPWKTTDQADLSACSTRVPADYRCCLQRRFKDGNFHTIVYTEGNLKAPPEKYGEFLCLLGNDIHVIGHDLPGGTMGTDDSAQAPIFNLHHAYVDYQWWRYLRTSAAHRASAMKYHTKHAEGKTMPGTDSKVWANITGTKPGGILAVDLLDSSKLGSSGQTCVTYEWDHTALHKRLTKDQVRKLSDLKQWAYLEDKLTQESFSKLIKTPHEKEPNWKVLQDGWSLFETPEACWDRIKWLQDNVLNGLDIVPNSKLAKDAEDEKTGVEIDKTLG